MIVAAADAVAEEGRLRLSAATIITRAGVSPRTFHAAFGTVEACLLAAFDEGLARATRAVGAAIPADATMLAKLETGLRALLRFLDEEPGWGRLLLIELPEQLRARRERAIAALSRVISDSWPGPAHEPAPPLAAERVTGEVLRFVAARMREGGSEPLLTLAPWLMSALIEPRPDPHGDSEALGTSVPPPAWPHIAAGSTGRTVRTLRAIARNPGANNRQIAQASGVPNDSYVSQQLGRLQLQGLIENVTGQPGRGHANAWVLTQAGETALAETPSPREIGCRAAA